MALSLGIRIVSQEIRLSGARIIYLLDTKVLKDLRFATFSFENNSTRKVYVVDYRRILQVLS